MIQFNQYSIKPEDVWLTSDTHLGHKNIVSGISGWEANRGQRKFNTLEEMDDTIINNINKYVKPDDILFHAGDWSFGGIKNIKKYRDLINCKNITIIRGNHDHHIDRNSYKDYGFTDFYDIGYFKVSGFSWLMCHYPIAIWHQSHHGVPLAFGHCHSSYKHMGKALDIGIDNVYKLTGEYRPINLLEFQQITNNLPILFESHHNENTN